MAILGRVVSINGLDALVGKVQVLKANGEKITLQLNDTVDPGDTIITPKGVIVELELINGKVMQIFAEQTVKITSELADAIPPSTGDSAVDYATIQTVINAINEGRDLSEVMEETAAGLEGGAGISEGHGFVNLPPIIEGINPLAFSNVSSTLDSLDIEPLFAEPNDDNALRELGDDGTGGPPAISTFSISDLSISEGGLMSFTVTRAVNTSGTQTVDFATSIGGGDTAEVGDFTGNSGTLTFNPGVVSQTFTVQTIQDGTFEGAETFTATLSNNSAGSTIVDATAVGTILDDGTGPGPFNPGPGADDDTPSITLTGLPVVNEAAGTITYTATLSNPSDLPVTVDYNTADGSATDGADFTGASGTLTFAAGVTTQTFTVDITDDTVFEGPEDFTANLTNPSNATIAVGTVTTTINDDGTGDPNGNPPTDDTPVVASVTSPSVTEGGNLDYTVTLSNASTTPTTVTLTPSSGTGTLGTDTTTPIEVSFDGGTTFATYTGPTLDVPAGVTSFITRIPTVDDAIGEGNETILLSANTTGQPPVVGTGDIVDNDTVNIVIDDVARNEGAGTITFTVSLTTASGVPVSVDYATNSGTATVGSDITANDPLTGTLNFAAGVTTQTITLNITDDAVYEGSESFTIDLSNPTGGALIGDAQGVGTITDDGTGPGGADDDTPSITLTGLPVVNEAAGTITYTATLSNPSDLPVTVDYNTADGSATDGADFTGASGTLTFAAGVTTQTFTVDITDDTVFEGPEDFTANLTNPSNATIAVGTVTTTINDDGTGDPNGNPPTDDTPVVASVTSPSVTEGGNLDYTVTLSNASTTPTTVTLTPSSGTGTLGTDTTTPIEVSFDGGTTFATYTGPTLDVPAGVTSFITRIPTVDDAIGEGNETILLSANTTGQPPVVGTGDIVDNDTVNIVIDDVARNEGAGTITFTVSLTTASGVPVSVDYATNSGTATVGSDITANDPLTGTLNFAAGVTTQTITLNITDDAVYEGSESFTIDLSNPTGGALIGDAQGVGTITDDGTGPGGADDDTTGFSIGDVSISEGGLMTFTVTRTGDAAAAQTVDFATSIGGGDTAEVGDFTGNSGTLTFNPGVVSQTFTVQTIQDGTFEGAETFTATLSNNSAGSTIVDATAVGTILDDGTGPGPFNPGPGADDDTPSITLTGLPVVNEAAGTITYTATLSNPSDLPVTVDYNTADGSATDGADFTGASGTLTFAAGVTTQTFTVDITDDTVFEGPEDFTANLTNPSNATIAVGTVTTTINDDGTGDPNGNPPTDDTTGFSIGDVSISEGGLMTFTVTRTGDAAAAQTVDFATSIGGGDTAEVGDFTGNSGTLTFNPGVVSQTFTVQTIQDGTFEGAETFTATLSNNSAGSTIVDATAVGTILDDGTGPGPFNPGPGADDDTPSITLTGLPVVNEAAGTITYTATLSNPSDLPVTVDYNTADGSATDGADFTGASGTLTFAAGVTTQTFTVDITDDTVFEGPEDFTANLTNPSNATIAVGTVTTTINDDGTGDPNGNPPTDDTPVVASVTSPSVTEGGNLDYTVTLSNASTTPTTVTLTPSSGTGTLGTDTTTPIEVSFDGGTTFATYTGPTLDVPAGVTSFITRIPTVDDAIGEGNETILLSANTTGQPPVVGTGDIVDNDTVNIVIDDVARNEGAGTITFTVSLTTASGVPVSVDYATNSGTATVGSDITANDPLTGTLNFAAGVTTQTITLNITDDAVYEGSESFTIDLSNPTGGALIGDAQGVGTITDDGTGPGGADDDTPSITLTGLPVVNEAAGTITYTATLSNPSDLPVTVDYNTADGSATDGADFTGASGTLTFAAGVTTQTFTVDITDDTVFEGPEDFTANLTNPSNATIAVGTVTTTINDDGTGDPNGNPPTDDTTGFSIGDVSISEGGLMTFTVTRTGDAAAAQTVDFATSIGGGDTAEVGDFTGNSGTLTFNPGVVSQTFTVQTIQDGTFEGAETFTATLSNNSAGSTIVDATAVGTILDDGTGPGPFNPGPGADDDTPSITLTGLPVVNEAAGTITYTATLSNPSDLPVTVDYNTADGSATDGADFTGASGTLTFAAGVTTQTFTVDITDDTVFEGPEDFTANLTNPSNATIAVGTVTTTINDDGTGDPNGNPPTDDTPSISIDDVVRNEDSGTITFTVSLSNGSASPISVDYATNSGTATVATDVTANDPLTGTVNFAAGVTTQTITLNITDDTIFEGSESFTVDLSNPTGGAVIADAQGVGTITDDDAAPTVASVSNEAETEGADLVHTVTLSNPSATDTTYSVSLVDGTATGGVDYTNTLTNASFTNGVTISGGTITVPAGVTSFAVTVPSTGDTIDEANETYTLNVGASSGTGTINDDDAAPTIASVTDDTQVEGTNLVHTVTLSNASSSATTHAFTLTDNTATGGGVDYTTPPTFSDGVTLAAGVLTVPAGVTSFTITVPTTLDTIDEGASEAYDLSVGGVAATGTITDDDAAPTVASVSNEAETEGADLVHTVTLSNPSATDTTYSVSLVDGTATGGVDYTNTLTNASFTNGVTISGGTITVPAGVTSFAVTVPSTGDTIDEANETYTLNVGASSGTGTINDDDAAPTIASVTDDTQVEGTNLVHTVTLSNASSSATTHAFTLTDNTATGGGVDYTTPPTFSDGVTLAAGVLTVPAGVTSFTITVPTTLDTIDEGASEAYDLSVGGVAATGTITDDDAAPTVASVSNEAETEGADLVHTVTLSNPSATDTTYSVSLVDGTATGGVDYTNTLTNASFTNGVTISGGTITVPAGVTSFAVTVPSTGDTIDEANETYTLNVGASSGTGTINDDDAAPTIASVTDDTQVEGTNLVHTVTLSNASSSATTHAFTLTDNTATGGGVDYTTPPTFSDGVTLAAGVLTVPAGVTSFTITVPTTLDTIDEGASEAYDLSVGGVAATGTITDDDAAPTVASVSNEAETEGADLVHTVTLSNPSATDTTYSVSLVDGTATGGVDYTNTLTNASFTNGVTISGGTITVPAGVTSFAVTVPSTGDTIDEANETYTLNVGASSGTGTINDDDAAPTIASVTDDTQVEGTNLVHTVTLSNASSSATTHAFTLTDNTATGGGVDYTTPPTFSDGVTLAAGVLTVPAGVTSFTITVPTTLDTIDEGASEAYDLSVGGVAATGTITDDDAAPTVASVSNEAETEGADLVHTVTLSNPSATDTTYSVSLVDGTATGGVDYTNTLTNASFTNGVTISGGTITVPAGVTSFAVTVPSTGDTIDEANETYTLNVGASSGTGTINDDDAAPTIASVTDDTQVEGTNLVHTVTLSNASSSATTHAFTLTDNTATGGGVDYTTPPTFSDGVTLAAGVLTVPAGVTSFTITVPTTLDTIDEGASEAYDLSVGGVAATGTITDDDAAPTVASVSNEAETEGADLVHTVTLSNPSATDTTYSVSLVDGTATGGVDYTNTLTNASFTNGVTISGGTITVPAGVTSFAVTVPSTGDTIDEANETYTLNVGASSGTGTINDDDAAPTIASVTDDTQVEGTNLVHTVTLSNASSSATTHAFTLTDNTATGGGVDYTTPPTFSDGVTLAAGVLTVPAGVTSFTITVPTTLDTIDEGASEAYDLSVGGVAATGTITDDDAAPTVASVSNEAETEGADLVHTVTLSNPSATDTTYSVSLVDGTATGGVDYTNTLTNASFTNGVTISGGTITVPAGVTSFAVTVPSTGDTIDEANETYTLNVGASSGTGTINDDDAAPTIASVTDDTQVEGTNLVHTVTLSNASSSATTHAFTLTDNTATGGGVDYTTPPTFSDGVTLAAGVLTVPAGVTSFTITVPTTLDTIDEGASEAYDLSVGGVAATGTITDDDAAPTVASVSNEAETEGADLVHTVTLSNPSATDTTYSVSLVDGTATGGVDYTNTLTNASFTNGVTISGGTITVPAGVTSFAVTVPSTGDTIDEANETYTLNVGASSGTGTINDDDAAPTIASVTDDTQVEGTNLVHTVTLSNASSSATTHAFTLTDNTATGGGVDYTTPPTFSDGVTLAAGVLTVPAGVTSFTITVPTTLDTIDEGASEAYDLSVGGVAATGTITDDDAAPTVASVSNEAETEGADLVHTVTLSNPSATDTTYSVSLVDGTATGGVDYTNTLTNASFTNGVTISGGTITVPAGVTSFAVTVPSTGDTIDEANETYTLNVGASSGTGTINDDDAAPTIASVTDDTQVEGTNLVHTVTLSNASSSATTHAFTLTDNTATGGGVDYTTPPTFSDGVTLAAGVLTVPAGVTSFTITVPTVDDAISEVAETYDMTVGGVAATGTITDNEPVPTVSSVTSDTEVEGASLVHTVTLSGSSSIPTTHAFTLTDNTATGGGVDYTTPPTFSDGVTLAAGVLTVPAGVTSFTITVPTTLDTIDEGASEAYDLSVGGVAATGTITDDDAAPTVASVSNEAETEGADLVHTVTLSNPSATDTTYSVSLVDGTATGGVDYTNTLTNASFTNGVTISGGTITVPAGVTSFAVTVPSTGDTIDEANETYTLNVGASSGTGTINDDDAAPTIASVTDDTQVEGTNLVHTVTLSNASSSATTHAFTLTDNTATGGGVDYTTPPTFSDGVTLAAGVLTVPAGVTSFTITVPTTLDTIDEGASEAYDLSVGGVAATGTITDDDAAPTVASVSNEAETEGADLVHTVTLSNPSATDTTYSVSLVDGTATGGVDYTNTLTNASFTNGVTISGGTITVPAGVTSFAVTVPSTGDTIDEANETYTLNVGASSGTGTINDDDSAPVDGNETNSVTEDVTLNVADGAPGDLLNNATDADGDTLTIADYTIAGIGGTQVVGAPVVIAGVGTITINANGSYSFAPVADYDGAIPVITYTVTDGTNTDTSTLSLSMTPVNDVPVDGDETNTVTEDTTLTVTDGSADDLLTNATDVDGDTLTVSNYTIAGIGGTQVVGVPVAIAGVGTIQINANGSYSFTPAPDYNGAVPVITYTVSDGNGGTDTSTLSLSITPVNDAPVAVDDSITVAEDTPFTSTVDLDANDTDPDGDPLTVVPGTFATTQGGSITIASDGSYTYTPPADYDGPDSVNYTVTDGTLTDVGTLNITVTPVNDAPVAVDDSITVAEDTPFTSTVDLDANDTDPDGDPLTVVPGTFATTQGGSITIASDGSYTYTPPADYDGPDSVNYTVTDGTLTDVGTLNITVTPVNDAPVAVDDSITVAEDTPFTSTVDLDANDTDPDGDPLTVVPGTFATTQGGSITIASDGSYTYTPPADYNGSDSVDYTVTDGTLTDVGTLNITVTPVNDAPQTTSDNDTAVEGTTTLKASVLANDSDPDGDAITVMQFATNNSGLNALTANGTNTVTTALGGTVVINTDGTYTYTAPARDHSDATGDIDSFAYMATDGTANSGWTVVNISITDTGPVAIDDVDSVGLGSTVTGNVITGDGGISADTLNVDTTHSLTGVVLTTGTEISNTLDGSTNVRTIETMNGTLAIDLDDGSYSYTLATPADIGVANSNGIASFTAIGVSLYGFGPGDDPYVGAIGSDLDLSTLNATSAAEVSDDTDGAGVSAGNDQINNDEQLVIDLGVSSKSVTLTVNNFGTTETAFFEAYRSDGTLVASGSQVGPGSPADINISAGEPFDYVVLRSQGNFFRLDGILISPEPTGAADVFTYTLTDSDGSTDTATLTMNYDNTVTAVNDAVSVYEAGIDGNGSQSAGTAEAATTNIATGNLLANDTGVTASTSISVTGATGPDANGVLTVTQPWGTVEVYTQDVTVGGEMFSKGDYVVNLTSSTTEGVDDAFNLNYTLTTGPSTSNATLAVTIVDDEPVVQNQVVQVQEGVLPDTNLVFVIDVSGSMAGEVKNVDSNGTVTIMNRLDATKLAVEAVINEYFSQGGNISIKLVAFESTATLMNGGAAYTDAASAIAALNTLSAGGGTNYEAGLQEAMNAYTMDGAVDTSENNVVYFISDGVPTSGDTTDPAANGYRAYATTNEIDTYAIGIGTGIADTTELDNIHNIDSDNSGSIDSAIIVSNVALLDEVLLASVPTSFGGSVTGNAASSSLRIGADGGYISGLTMSLDTNADNVPDTDVTFNYDGSGQITVVGGFPASGFPLASNSLTLDASNGFTDGILTFNFDTGEYVYQTAGQAAEGDEFDINFTAIDGDGDTASGTQTVQIIDGQPKAVNDIDTLRNNETSFEGNVISGISTDGGDNVQLTDFSTGRSGEDNPGDGGTVSSIVFQGVTFDLTTPVGATAALGGTYTVTSSGGVNTFAWNASSGGESLTFTTDGYYNYSPPAAEISTNSTGPSTNFNLTSAGGVAAAATAGMTFAGIARNSSVEGSATTSQTGDGVGVNGNNNSRVDQLESLVINFDTSLHPHGVQDVIINLDNTNSNLGGSLAVGYTVYDVHGDLLGQFSSNDEAPFNVGFAGIGKIVIDSGGFNNPYASIFDISFSTIVDTPGTPAPAPEVITYTLTDIDGDTSTATLTLNNIIDDIAGTAAAETITGTAKNESISGLDGDDVINAGAGYDKVRGGDGVDTIDGGADDDQLYGEGGDDNISGGTGADLIYGDAGNDTLNGNDGADTIFGGDGNDIIDGGAGADTIIGGPGNDILTGGTGVDVFKWELNDEATPGTPAQDVITDFDPSVGTGDILDLRDLLVGEQHVTGIGNLDSYLYIELVGADTVVHVSHNGGFSDGYTPSSESQTITLTGVDLVSGVGDSQAVIQDMLTNNQLIVD